jgi:integrase
MAPQRFRNKWRVQIRVGGKIRGTVWTRKMDAEKEEAKLKIDQEYVRAGMELPKEEILFFDYAQRWIKKRTLIRPQATWRADERNLRNHWLPLFSNRPLMTLNKIEIRSALEHFLEVGLSNATHNRLLQLLHKLYEDAIDDGKALLNPAARIKRLPEKKKSRKTSLWTDEREIEAYIRGAYLDRREYGLFAVLALYSGARVGELIALQFRDIEWQNEQIRIRRTLERVSGIIQERTKGQKEGGEYCLPLLPRVETAILETKALTRFHGPSDFIIQNPDGSPLSYWTLQKAHRRICQKAGVPRITIHDMRRTFASMAEQKGFSRGDIQAMLGHESITTTESYIRKNISQLTAKAKLMGFGVTSHTGAGREEM